MNTQDYENKTVDLEQEIRSHAEEIFTILHKYQAEGFSLITEYQMLQQEKDRLEDEKHHLELENQQLRTSLDNLQHLDDQPRTPDNYSTEPTF